MKRIDISTAVTNLPVPAAAGVEGFFTDGNPGGGEGATVVTADWLNQVQEEIIAVIDDAGLAHSKVDHTQLKQAIHAIIAANVPVGQLLAAQNLNDVANKVTSRSNLGVPGYADVPAVYGANVSAGGVGTYVAIWGFSPSVGSTFAGSSFGYAGTWLSMMVTTIGGWGGSGPLCSACRVA